MTRLGREVFSCREDKNKELIAIARAIIRKSRILLLDKATSALDSESERVVQDAIEDVAKGRTTIIVAHRLSTIKNADAIAVVESGQIKEIGSRNELIQKENGLYDSLACLQQIEREKNPTEDKCSSFFASTDEFKNNRTDCLLDMRKSNGTTIAISSSLIATRDFSDNLETPKLSFWRLLGWYKPE